MLTSEENALWLDWKKRSEIDYIPLFISLWLALSAWMRDRYRPEKDRQMLELLKGGGNTLSDRFAELLYVSDSNGSRFRGSFGELHRALQNANIRYQKEEWKDEIISFESCPIEWEKQELESVLEGREPARKN